ncbi:hypothetical protein HDV00_003391 [Rhizophlyctis rosea]|nr:hypothetical protein HDV00_003391 [Rhizophlyctis rosea]
MAHVKSYIDTLLASLSPAPIPTTLNPDNDLLQSPVAVSPPTPPAWKADEEDWVDLSKGSPPTSPSHNRRSAGIGGDKPLPRPRDSGVDVDEMTGIVPQPSKPGQTIPRFYHPSPRPSRQTLQARLNRMRSLFPGNGDGLDLKEFRVVTKACRLPVFFNAALFRACLCGAAAKEGEEWGWEDVVGEEVGWEMFARTYLNLHTRTPHTTLPFSILDIRNKHHLTASDLDIIIQDILAHHPAFSFLSPSSPFHSLYAKTVTTRLLYEASSHATRGRMDEREFRKVGVVEMVEKVEKVEGCLSSEMPGAFSYRDFYVCYCQFYDLDGDRDMLLTVKDFQPYTEDTLSQTVIRRVMELYGKPAPEAKASAGAKSGKRGKSKVEGKVFGFEEFVAFHTSLTTPHTPPALTYWFRTLDADSDGIIRGIELEPFWRGRQRCHFSLPPHSPPCPCDEDTDSLRSFLKVTYDLLNPTRGLEFDGGVRLGDLKRNPQDGAAFLVTVFTPKGGECGCLKRRRGGSEREGEGGKKEVLTSPPLRPIPSLKQKRQAMNAARRAQRRMVPMGSAGGLIGPQSPPSVSPLGATSPSARAVVSTSPEDMRLPPPDGAGVGRGTATNLIEELAECGAGGSGEMGYPKYEADVRKDFRIFFLGGASGLLGEEDEMVDTVMRRMEQLFDSFDHD